MPPLSSRYEECDAGHPRNELAAVNKLHLGKLLLFDLLRDQVARPKRKLLLFYLLRGAKQLPSVPPYQDGPLFGSLHL